jgi:hypothetical protein
MYREVRMTEAKEVRTQFGDDGYRYDDPAVVTGVTSAKLQVGAAGRRRRC